MWFPSTVRAVTIDYLGLCGGQTIYNYAVVDQGGPGFHLLLQLRYM